MGAIELSQDYVGSVLQKARKARENVPLHLPEISLEEALLDAELPQAELPQAELPQAELPQNDIFKPGQEEE